MLPELNRQTAQITTRYPERIVQFGGGNFLRGFVDWMVELLNAQTEFDSSVVIVKLRAQGAYDALDAQQGLFHVRLHGMEAGELVTDTTLITCVSRSVNPYDDYDSYLSLARQLDIRFIVSNTTEAGIAYDPTNRFEDRPASSFPGKLTQFLVERYRHFSGDPDRGCIFLPCELIEGNADQLKAIILQYADLWQIEAGFLDWIRTSNQFCNTLVDRIVSGFPQDSSAIFEQLGYTDHLLVEGERYYSWIIEAPPSLHDELPVQLTTLSVSIVDDLQRYRVMKVRVLNGAHTALVPLGLFLGLTTVREAIDVPALGQFLRALIFTEIVPTLTMDDAAQYADAVLTRFHNPFIQHRLQSIALNSLSKFKTRLLPSLLDYQAQHGQLPQRIVFAFAALIRFYKGDWMGSPLPVNDDPAHVAWFQQLWQSKMSERERTEAVLGNESLWGMDLTTIPGLTDQLSSDLERIGAEGVASIISRMNGV